MGGHAGPDLDLEGDARREAGRAEEVDHRRDERGEGEVGRLKRKPPGLDLREVEDVVDDVKQVFGAVARGLHVTFLFGIERRVGKEAERADHRVHRRADLVADDGDEVGFRRRRRLRHRAPAAELLLGLVAIGDVAQDGDESARRQGRSAGLDHPPVRPLPLLRGVRSRPRLVETATHLGFRIRRAELARAGEGAQHLLVACAGPEQLRRQAEQVGHPVVPGDQAQVAIDHDHPVGECGKRGLEQLGLVVGEAFLAGERLAFLRKRPPFRGERSLARAHSLRFGAQPGEQDQQAERDQGRNRAACRRRRGEAQEERALRDGDRGDQRQLREMAEGDQRPPVRRPLAEGDHSLGAGAQGVVEALLDERRPDRAKPGARSGEKPAVGADEDGRRSLCRDRGRQAAEERVGIKIGNDEPAEGPAGAGDPAREGERDLAGERVGNGAADHGAAGIEREHAPADLGEIDRDPPADGTEGGGENSPIPVHHGEGAERRGRALGDGEQGRGADRVCPAARLPGQPCRRLVERNEVATQMVLEHNRGELALLGHRFLGRDLVACELHDHRNEGEDHEEKADRSDAEPPAPTVHSSTRSRRLPPLVVLTPTSP
ncbi:MAG: hypothetical protein RML45_11760 [Acetobacteraceae bacterium]|nr:hypothetical protein [Acetobacteraceae bacterium]